MLHTVRSINLPQFFSANDNEPMWRFILASKAVIVFLLGPIVRATVLNPYFGKYFWSFNTDSPNKPVAAESLFKALGPQLSYH